MNFFYILYEIKKPETGKEKKKRKSSSENWLGCSFFHSRKKKKQSNFGKRKKILYNRINVFFNFFLFGFSDHVFDSTVHSSQPLIITLDEESLLAQVATTVSCGLPSN